MQNIALKPINIDFYEGGETRQDIYLVQDQGTNKAKASKAMTGPRHFKMFLEDVLGKTSKPIEDYITGWQQLK